MTGFSFIRNRWLAFAHDLAWVPMALVLAFWFRFNLETIPTTYWHALQSMLVITMPIQVASFWFFGLYRGIWRYASIPDLVRIAKAVALGSVLTFVALFIWMRLVDIPRSVLLLYPMLLAAGLAIPRLLYRWLKDRHLKLVSGEAKAALVVGAGRAGELLIRDLLKDEFYLPVGLLDDMPRKQGMEMHGVRVLGGTDRLAELVPSLGIDVVLIAMPSAPSALMRRLVATCAELKVPCRTLPSVAELAEGKVERSALRELRIEDLLGREEIKLDEAEIRHLIGGKRVLVTGAGGSIGSELCRQIAAHAPDQLIMLDNGEFNLYRIEQEMGSLHADGQVSALLGDIRDHARMQWLFEHYRPQVVFNAAAYKHVPLVEENPAEGVKTNVLGTCQLADLAVEFNVEKFVQVSTDKAVNPTNVMGATKRAAEIYCQNLNARTASTAFITTRFGNVLGSAGSVVPLFREQIARGGPVTVTHPEITRYFMTIPEAVSLILQAGSMGKGGEIFVLDMGEPVKIVDLAAQMIRLAGLEPDRDIPIAFTGLRPGEKLYEELFHEAESLVGTGHPKIMQAGSREVAWEEIRQLLERLQQASEARDITLLRHELKALVPEFVGAPEATDGKPAGEVLH
jgi:FlaA1/EpsC-like NDP-sugar epimerase